jgi:hypothetical protein
LCWLAQALQLPQRWVLKPLLIEPITVLDNARGLRAKPAIYFKGLEIGRVEAFKLDTYNNDINVDFYIYSQYQSKVVPGRTGLN